MAQIYEPVAQPNNVVQRLYAVARTLRRRRRLRLMIRALWVALAVWCVGLVALLLGLALNPALLLGASAMTWVVGAAYAWFSHPSLARLAQGLDRHYRLAQQVTTALEVARHTETQPLEERLLQETEALLVRMQRYIASRSSTPWREVETLVAMALLALGLTVATHPLLPEAANPVALPDLPAPVTSPTAHAQAQPTEQPIAEQQQQPLSPEAQAAADAIADALRDNGATRSAADALDRGDTNAAASELRELADQADQLSEEARRDIAQGLRNAADQLGQDQPGLADELRRQADALEAGGQQAEQALEDLARTVEQLSEDGQQAAEAEPSAAGEQSQPGQGEQQAQQGEGQQQGEQGGGAGAGDGDGLGAERRSDQPGAQAQGETLPLPQPSTAGGPTTPATGPKGPTIELGAGGTGTSENLGGANGDQPLAGEADPLTIPLEYRDVVEDYFSPQP